MGGKKTSTSSSLRSPPKKKKKRVVWHQVGFPADTQTDTHTDAQTHMPPTLFPKKKKRERELGTNGKEGFSHSVIT